MMNRLFIFIILLIFVPGFIRAQQNSFTAQPMSKSINSEFNEFNPVISPDGKVLYFTRASHPDNAHKPHVAFGPEDSEDIWFSVFKDGSWSDALRMPFPLNSGIYNSIHSISDDGKTILVNGIFDKKNRWVKRGLSICVKEADGWSYPAELNIKGKLRKNRGVASNAFMTGDAQMLFLSYSKKYGGKKQDLFVSMPKEGKWSKPVKLTKNVSSKKFNEEAPFYHPGQQRLYFTRNKGGAGKDALLSEIYYTTPTDKTFLRWSDPVKYSNESTKECWESYFKLNPKGSWAYFASDKDSKGYSDIYRIKIFEENPFVQVSGQVRELRTGLGLAEAYPFQIYADNVLIDSVKINPSDATFVIKLPLGKKYVVKAEAKNHQPIPDTIDASGQREYFEISRNLFVRSVPYVVMSGKILDKYDLKPIPLSSNPKILLDGKEVSLEDINYDDGNYKMNLKYGMKHTISVIAKGYDENPEVVDLKDIHEYQEIGKDLYVQKHVAPDPNEAIITGKIYDKKTGQLLSIDKPFKILANEIPATEVNINQSIAEYKLILPLGKTYVINASVQGYYPVYEIIDLSKETKSLKIIKDLTIAPIEVGMSIKLNNIFFETGKATLKKQSFPELDRVVKFLKENNQIKIELAGHTDNVGAATSNLTLSQNRAASVVKYISGKGIASERLIAKGYGMTKPVATNATKAGKALNRRVEFTILEK